VRIVQVLVAVGFGAAIFGIGLWAVRMLAATPPPEPDPEQVVEVAAAYRCSICGLRLVVTHAPTAAFKAPRHCREEMEPQP
jgi:hypothetical protein